VASPARTASDDAFTGQFYGNLTNRATGVLFPSCVLSYNSVVGPPTKGLWPGAARTDTYAEVVGKDHSEPAVVKAGTRKPNSFAS
jgi:hypothetical protein